MSLIIDIAEYLVSGMCVGFYGIISALPIYEQLDSIKEQLIACALGIPVALVSAVLTIVGVGKIINKFTGLI